MYNAEISRKNPSLFLFLIDQSGSMSEIGETGEPLSKIVSDCINRVIYEIVLKCTGSEIKNYFDIGVISYFDDSIYNNFSHLGKEIVYPISIIGDNPIRFETRKKTIYDISGRNVETSTKVPIWFEPYSEGKTPMCAAFDSAKEILSKWCEDHRESYPPILINLTDGESTDGDPEQLAEEIRSISTNDGNILIFNVHITSKKNLMNTKSFLFNDNESILPDENAKKLFRMSSIMPESMIRAALAEEINVSELSRGYCYNSDLSSLIKFLDIGTKPSNLR